MEDNSYLMISALQHFAFCPRQFALIHIEQAWEENRFTAEGKVLHERVDSGITESRGNVRYDRGVQLRSDQFRLKGKMDLLEVETVGDSLKYFPVEYKRGKPKLEDWDRIQLCAQAICIEEMRELEVSEGAIWYWEVRKRQTVSFDESLRKATIDSIESAHNILLSNQTPRPTVKKTRCRACSLSELCKPELFRHDHSAKYLAELFSDEKIT